ncbi:CCA tRNA nucleotidyltransferase [Reyranella soli]|uniref:Poly(A) polymerase n=1 Tax=Reyranella soli TaxID=1230389 RepID=A0A512NSP3_9HYPH|nr:CCA tRNA nucleotidyltransferase [Reyranella soli]GEP61976.1 poly(A) polymerase [Reyranella soli]
MTPPWMNEAPVRTLLAALAGGGITARFVGGCVRDWVLDRPISDIDIAVDKAPETVTKVLEAADIKVVPTGLKHGTVTAIVKSRPFEITTLRRDVETDGRRAIVAFTDDWRTDAERRDFTFNALYAEPDGTIHDYFDGQVDLLAGRVRFIGDPEQRIAEDRLRVLRFFRFHARFGKPPFHGPSFDACRRNAATVSGLSGERVAKELLRTLDAPGGADAFDAMLEAGVLDHWLPEYAGSTRLRALAAREGAAREEKADALRRLAAILPVDANATAIGKRLRLSTQDSVRLQLMLDPGNAIDTTNLRASLYRLGTKLFIDRVLLDAPGDWRAALALAGSWTPPELPIGGNDALALGLKPGPKVGALIEAVERWWVAGDFSADRAACLAELKRLADAQA